MKRYSESLEQWEQEAYHDGYGADWLADKSFPMGYVGPGIKLSVVLTRRRSEYGKETVSCYG